MAAKAATVHAATVRVAASVVCQSNFGGDELAARSTWRETSLHRWREVITSSGVYRRQHI